MSEAGFHVLARRLRPAALVLTGALLLGGCAPPTPEQASSHDAAAPEGPREEAAELKTPSIAVNLPAEHNTPDGMTLDEQNNIILSCPNFNDPSHPAWLMKITPDDKLEKYFQLPLHPETNRACPLGIDFGSDGNLYIADSQALGGAEDYKSRLVQLVIEDGKPVRAECVVDGFVFSNAVACYGDHVYVTETKLEPTPGEGPMASGVYRFAISEFDPANPIVLEQGGEDPHLVVKLSTKNEDWKVGANGLGFAADGTMYVGNFGDAQLIAVVFDAGGNVASQKIVVEGDPIKSTDGLKVDQETGLVYIADFVGNAVHCVEPATGKVTVIARNGLTDGAGGLLDKCSEVCLRDNKVYVANIDLDLDGNTFDEPYTVSVIELD